MIQEKKVKMTKDEKRQLLEINGMRYGLEVVIQAQVAVGQRIRIAEDRWWGVVRKRLGLSETQIMKADTVNGFISWSEIVPDKTQS